MFQGQLVYEIVVAYLHPSSFGGNQVIEEIEINLLAAEGRAPFERRPTTQQQETVNAQLGTAHAHEIVLTLLSRENAVDPAGNRPVPSRTWPHLCR